MIIVNKSFNKSQTKRDIQIKTTHLKLFMK